MMSDLDHLLDHPLSTNYEHKDRSQSEHDIDYQ